LRARKYPLTSASSLRKMGMGYPKLQREDSPDQKEVLSHLESQVALLLKA